MRRVLLIEPNYKNKYPPMGLMKLSTYHKMLGDEVHFYKGELRTFILEEIYIELLEKLKFNDPKVHWESLKNDLVFYIRTGSTETYVKIQRLSSSVFVHSALKYYRNYFHKKEYLNNPKWDRICVSTLFTFHWKITIETINFAKHLCKSIDEVWVGGVMASVVPDEIQKETGVKPVVGLLDLPGIMDNNDIVIDHLPLDYSIIEETDYVYPENDAYYAYMTRGCINRCPFCAVPKIEPKYNGYISIKDHIDKAKGMFGERCNLLLLDNNVLASEEFDRIIDEIKACGFDKKTKFIRENPFEVAIRNLKTGYNDKAYIKSAIKHLKNLVNKSSEENASVFFTLMEVNGLLSEETATKKALIEVSEELLPHFRKLYKAVPRDRHVDFNQGIDARLLTEEKVLKLTEIPVRPLRIAFDEWSLKDIYERAVRLAVKHGIRDLSNYVLYNYKDRPIDLYRRLRLNVELCDTLDVGIYSFPMKYHPIQDKKYFMNRDYIGVHWNKKYIRAIQAILNSTKGKIGRGMSFFEEAFGKDDAEFEKLLYMPETMIIYRFHYKENGITDLWWQKFTELEGNDRDVAVGIIHNNKFDFVPPGLSPAVQDVLSFYRITRDIAESDIKAMA